MGFKKGHKKYGGRKKGSKNTDSKDVSLAIQDFVTRKFEEIEEIWAEMDAVEKGSFLAKMTAYAAPKLRSVENDIRIENLSDESLRRLAEIHIENDNG